MIDRVPREPGVGAGRRGRARDGAPVASQRIVSPSCPTSRPRADRDRRERRSSDGRPDARRAAVTPVRLGAATVLVIAVLVAGLRPARRLRPPSRPASPRPRPRRPPVAVGDPRRSPPTLRRRLPRRPPRPPATERRPPTRRPSPPRHRDRRAHADADRNPTGHGRPEPPGDGGRPPASATRRAPAPARRLAGEALRPRRVGRDAVGRRPHLAGRLGRRRRRGRPSR